MSRRKKNSRQRRRQFERRGGTGDAGAPSVADVVAMDAADAELVEQPPQVVQALPPKQQQQLLIQAQRFSGPLPHPAILKGYDEVVPGSANRIMTQFEEQGRHRRKQESRVISHRLFSSALGQILSFVVFMTLAVGGGWLIYQGKSVEGSGAIVTGIGAAIWALHGARKEQKQEISEKREAGKTVARRK